MKIGTILTATDLNPLYVEFVPLFISAWHTLFPEADIVIVLVASEIPTYLLPYTAHIRLSPPIEGMKTAFQAQCIRLLYPRHIMRNEGVIISDMDMIPMNRSYYEKPIKDFADDMFISYRDVLLPSQLPMCYNIAHPSIWKSVFGSETDEEILWKWYGAIKYDGIHGGLGWSTDQFMLMKAYNTWPGPKIVLNDKITGYRRLDRIHPHVFERRDELSSAIRSGTYSDYHCLRPHSKYIEINNWVAEQLRYQYN